MMTSLVPFDWAVMGLVYEGRGLPEEEFIGWVSRLDIASEVLDYESRMKYEEN